MINQFSASVVNLVENSINVNVGVTNQDEEEENSKENKETKEIKIDFIKSKNFDFTFLSNNGFTKIGTFYLISEYNVSTKIKILPPKQV